MRAIPSANEPQRQFIHYCVVLQEKVFLNVLSFFSIGIEGTYKNRNNVITMDKK